MNSAIRRMHPPPLSKGFCRAPFVFVSRPLNYPLDIDTK